MASGHGKSTPYEKRGKEWASPGAEWVADVLLRSTTLLCLYSVLRLKRDTEFTAFADCLTILLFSFLAHPSFVSVLNLIVSVVGYGRVSHMCSVQQA